MAIRYIIVNDRAPRDEEACCCMCASRLEGSYLREVGTRILYCTHWCYDEHVLSAVVAMAGRVA
jgi:hypothetical protein